MLLRWVLNPLVAICETESEQDSGTAKRLGNLCARLLGA